jgi:hypothetical protein
MIIFRRLLFIVFFFACSLSLSISPAWADRLSEEETNRLLSSAESLFLAMRARQYTDIWPSLTESTKKSIVAAVYREAKKAGTTYDRETIEADFKDGGAMAKTYWDGYLSVFKPDGVLEESRWTIGAVRKDKAEISILHKKSEKPALLQLYKEGNRWKVGLEETFGARNVMPF